MVLALKVQVWAQTTIFLPEGANEPLVALRSGKIQGAEALMLYGAGGTEYLTGER